MSTLRGKEGFCTISWASLRRGRCTGTFCGENLKRGFFSSNAMTLSEKVAQDAILPPTKNCFSSIHEILQKDVLTIASW